jgi:hypothetical protein
MMAQRHKRFFFLFLLGAVIAGVVYLYYQYRISAPQKVGQEDSLYGFPKHRLRIGGFQFEGHFEGRRTISIKADNFTIQKMKLGFFRFGLMNVARLKNAVIDIYGRRDGSDKKSAPDSSEQTTGRLQPNAQLGKGIIFEDVFRKESLPSFSTKRIHSIMIEPVCVNLHDEKSLVTQITASSATIRLKARDISFKGGVRVVSGSRSLMTDQVSLVPENGILKTRRHFILESPGKRLEGEQLTTDVFLKTLPCDH